MSRTAHLHDRITTLVYAVNHSFAVTADPRRNCRTCRYKIQVAHDPDTAFDNCYCTLTDRDLGHVNGINGYSCGCWERGEE